MDKYEQTIQSIRDAVTSHGDIARAQVREWIQEEDIGILHLVWNEVVKYEYKRDRVQPALDAQEVEDFRFRYFERLLKENPPLQFEEGRDEAVADIRKWFWDLDDGFDEPDPVRAKEWLGRIYLDSSADVQAAITHGILDRLFEYRRWRMLFSDWYDYPGLREVYQQAAEVGASLSGEDEIDGIEAGYESDEPIPQVMVKCWMASTNMDVLGCLWEYILTSERAFNRIEPPLSIADLARFYHYYYARCIKEDPDAKWGASRYEAADHVHLWFETASDEHLETLVRVKDWLTALYLEGDEDVRDAIVCGALEHILEQPRWRSFFKDWCDDPILREAYERAMEWAVWHDEQASHES